MTDLAACSFCGKRQDQVKQLVASGNGAFMCDECVALSYEIMVEEGALPPLMTNQEP